MHARSLSRRFALIAGASALALAAAPVFAADKDNFLIVPGRSFGPIKKGTTLADVERIYGKANVRVGQVQPPHGDFQKQRAAVIFPGTPDEAEAYLVDGATRVERVVVHKVGGRWNTKEGLRIGTTLAALEKMLGGPFPISAYGQDGGGAVGETRKSALPRHLFIRLAPDAKKRLSDADTAAMNKNFRSDSPAARRAGLMVSVIWWDLTR
jgi:hypothetical protein